MADSLKEAPTSMNSAALDTAQQDFGSKMVWDGYIYKSNKITKACSWWRCCRNRSKDMYERMCLSSAMYNHRTGSLRIKGEHSHGPETTSQNYIPPTVRLLCQGEAESGVGVGGFVSAMDRSLLFSHTETQGVAKRHKCNVCDLSFVLARVLETHMMLEHRVTTDWKCVHCGMQFLQKMSLQIHTKNSHSSGAPSTQNETDTSDKLGEFETRDSRSNQNVAVGTKIDAGIKPNVNMKSKKAGKVEKAVFSCQVCAAQFRYSYLLRNHMRSHTGELPYKCPLCPRAFRLSTNRNGHIKSSHNKVRKHLCDWCGKRFTNKRTLQDHYLTHTGKKPYSCQFCQRSFSRLSSMKVHLRQHTGEKPFTCDLCGQAYTVKVSLRAHLKSKHGIIVDTSMYKRNVDPADHTIPSCGRPKRKYAEQQLIFDQQSESVPPSH